MGVCLHVWLYVCGCDCDCVCDVCVYYATSKSVCLELIYRGIMYEVI